MAYYSFVVIAPQPLGIPSPTVLLDKGVNTFAAVVDNLEEFLKNLEDEGVVVKQVNRLDDHEPGGLDGLE